MKIFEPSSTSSAQVDRAKIRRSTKAPEYLSLQDPQKELVATAIPKVVTLHLDKDPEHSLVILIISMTKTLVWSAYTMFASGLPSMIHTGGFSMAKTIAS